VGDVRGAGLVGLEAQEGERSMTVSAWIMLAITWSVISFFTVGFFVAVVRTPPREGD
jgi:hypothetical protein